MRTVYFLYNLSPTKDRSRKRKGLQAVVMREGMEPLPYNGFGRIWNPPLRQTTDGVWQRRNVTSVKQSVLL